MLQIYKLNCRRIPTTTAATGAAAGERTRLINRRNLISLSFCARKGHRDKVRRRRPAGLRTIFFSLCGYNKSKKKYLSASHNNCNDAIESNAAPFIFFHSYYFRLLPSTCSRSARPTESAEQYL